MTTPDQHPLQAPSAPKSFAIREIREDEAEQLLQLQERLDAETQMMTFEPGERSPSIDALQSRVRTILASPNSTIIVADSDSRLVGYVEAAGGRYRRTRHTAYVVIGVLQSHQGHGIGRGLLAALRAWAVDHGVSRLELTVRADNEPARRLYEHAGFVIEGLRRESLRLEGEPVDELAMSLLLDARRSPAAAADELRIRVLRPDEHPWLEQQLIRRWGSTQLVSRGRAHQASKLPAFVCQAAEETVGLATIDMRDRQCELVSLDAFTQGRGIGSALLTAVVAEARRHECHRVWLITTNDNLRALRFYQRRGLRVAAVHQGAADEARRIKPSIPLVGEHGIPIHDELELELRLD